MKYWIQKTNGLITRSGFGEKPVEAEYETNIHKYSIDDCYLQGTEFQILIWKAITSIDVGKTVSYRDLVSIVGRGSAQAAGTACAKNKILVIIPCHRVVGKKNRLAFSGGPDIKRELLRLEGIKI